MENKSNSDLMNGSELAQSGLSESAEINTDRTFSGRERSADECCSTDAKNKSALNQMKIRELCTTLLGEIGEDPGREGLVKTPDRYARAMEELTIGYRQSVEDLVGDAVFHEDYTDMVVVRGIEFYSLCEHHILPFLGHATVAYIPNGKIIGLSKIPRIVNMFARRLQVQERLTNQITAALDDLLKPQGVACMIEANHMCMMMRGVQNQSSSMITTGMTGCFLEDEKTREEFTKVATTK